jgi:hypothetical protein
MRKNFVWENWKQVTNPVIQGGLGIRDLELMNLAMGEKLVWSLIIGKPIWWKHAICKKYFRGPCICCLDYQP